MNKRVARSKRRLGIEKLDDRLVLSANPLTIDAADSLGDNAIAEVHEGRLSFRNLEVATSSVDVVDAATDFLNTHYSDLGLPVDVTDNLRLLEVKHGLASSHVRFEQTHEGVKVYDSFVSVHFNDSQSVQTVHNAYRSIVTNDRLTDSTLNVGQAIEIAAKHADVEETFAEPRHELVWNVDKAGNGELAWQVTVFGYRPSLGDFLTVVDAETGSVVSQENRMAFATGSGDVFEPNPYQTQGSGGGMNDNNDANSAILDAQMVNVTLERLDDGTGLLNGEWVNLASLNGNIGDVDANEPSRVYNYRRDDPRFEQVVIYHSVDQIQEYFHDLGFDDDTGTANGIRDFPTLASAHWFQDDQSFYSTGNDAIHFGDGGVDDGEDADIVAHEYGHAVQHDQNAFWGGGEMGAMGEGFGDYLAATFYADFGDAAFQADHAPAVGEWDATSYSSANPPNLRRVDGDKMYPFDLSGSVHADGEIWSAALWDIRGAIGATTIDQLVLESHFALPGGASMRDAANAILTADANLNGGANAADIEFWFEERGILGEVPADDHGNDAASATAVGTPSITSALIESATDVDYFKFSADAGGAYEITTILGSLSDSTLTLYDTNGFTEIDFDDDGGPGLASRIAFEPTASGEYFIKVDNFSTQAGSYDLSIEEVTPGVDDHGDSAADATPVDANSSTTGLIEVESDTDWFSFTVPGGANVTLDTSLGSISDTTLTLIDSDGSTQLEFDDDSGPGLASSITWTAPAAGTYFAIVDNFSVQIGTYTLDITSDGVLTSGDFDADGDYDCNDVDALVADIAAGSDTALYDLSGDGVVDMTDLDAWLVEAGEANLGPGRVYLQGDADLNGAVDVSDFNVWNANKFTTTGAWCLADFNADGSTDVGDFNIWNSNKFTASAAPAVDGRLDLPSTSEEVTESLAEGVEDVVDQEFDSLQPVVNDLPTRRISSQLIQDSPRRRSATVESQSASAFDRVFANWHLS